MLEGGGVSGCRYLGTGSSPPRVFNWDFPLKYISSILLHTDNKAKDVTQGRKKIAAVGQTGFSRGGGLRLMPCFGR